MRRAQANARSRPIENRRWWPPRVARLRDHLGRHVDADHAPRATDTPRCKKAVEACAAAKIEYRLARAQRRNGLRIPAPKTEIGSVWDARQVFFRVAQVQASAS